MSRPARHSVVLAACVLLALSGATLATAAFTSVATGGPEAVAAATLAAPGTPTATPGTCKWHPSWTQSIALSWTATTSTFADGEQVLRATTSGGPYTSIATLAANATSYSDTGTAPSTTYYYVIRATKLSWTSDSGETPATTKSSTCV